MHFAMLNSSSISFDRIIVFTYVWHTELHFFYNGDEFRTISGLFGYIAYELRDSQKNFAVEIYMCRLTLKLFWCVFFNA